MKRKISALFFCWSSEESWRIALLGLIFHFSLNCFDVCFIDLTKRTVNNCVNKIFKDVLTVRERGTMVETWLAWFVSVPKWFWAENRPDSRSSSTATNLNKWVFAQDCAQQSGAVNNTSTSIITSSLLPSDKPLSTLFLHHSSCEHTAVLTVCWVVCLLHPPEKELSFLCCFQVMQNFFFFFKNIVYVKLGGCSFPTQFTFYQNRPLQRLTDENQHANMPLMQSCLQGPWGNYSIWVLLTVWMHQRTHTLYRLAVWVELH